MHSRPLGSSGLAVSAVGLGCSALGGRIDFDASKRVVHKALDLGVTLFDTANSYGNRYGTRGGSEIALGRLLGSRRKDVVLATKFGTQSRKHAAIAVEGASRAEIRTACEESLKRLQTDWIDLYQLHHPDPRTPIEETLHALDDLVREGKVRFAGCSNLPAWRVADAQWSARVARVPGFVTVQGEYSLLARDAERELLPALEHYGVGLLPTYPLAAGLLTGKYGRDVMPQGARLTMQQRLADKYLTEQNWGRVERLSGAAGRLGRTVLELAFGWLLANRVVASVIAGATSAAQVELNVKAGACPFGVEELSAIENALAPDSASRAARCARIGRAHSLKGQS